MSTSSAYPGTETHDHSRAIEITALTFGGLFGLVGVLGFVPGITTNYSQLSFAGHESNALLLGVFQVSVLHNIVHLLFGAAGLLMGRTARQSRFYLFGGGLVYLVLWGYGLLIDQASTANFVPVNTADNWLHAALGVVMVALGFILGRGISDAGRSRS